MYKVSAKGVRQIVPVSTQQARIRHASNGGQKLLGQDKRETRSAGAG